MFGRFTSFHRRSADRRSSLAVSPRRQRQPACLATLGSLLVLGSLGALGCVPEDGLPPLLQQDPPPALDDLPTAQECEAVNPVPAQARLLTRLQYDNTVRDLFHGLVEGPFTGSFPAENEVMGFGNHSEHHRATPWLAEEHIAASEAIAAQLVGVLPELLPCAEHAADVACAASFLRDYGARAFRRPLSDAEQAPFLQAFEAAASDAGFEAGIALVVQAMLQSPQFLYRFERSQEHPLAAGRGFAVTDYELASRLSYFFWNSMPDDQLFEAAAAGRLREDDELEAQARRLLEHPRARATVLDFYRQWLSTRRLNSVVRLLDEQEELALGASWNESLERFLDWTFWEGEGNLEALLSSPVVFVDAKLAALYDAPLSRELAASEWAAVEFDPAQRAGLLTQPALMALLSHSEQSAPIQRGVFVLDRLLCQPPPSPPPSVDQSPPDPDPSLTTRERFREHTEQPACSSCHRVIDPFGLGLESFDQLGRFRTEENGVAIDVSGSVVGTYDERLRGPFVGARELVERLARSEQVERCVVTQWYRYALGRTEQAVDRCSIAQVESAMRQHDGSFKEMMVAIALSDAFRYRDEQSETEQP